VANLLVCLGLLSCWNVHIKDISSSVYDRMTFLSIFTKTCWSMISSIKRMGPTPLYEKFAHTMILRPSAYRPWDFILGGTRCLVVDGHTILNCSTKKHQLGLICPKNISTFWKWLVQAAFGKLQPVFGVSFTN